MCRILLIDDDRQTAGALVAMLRALGHEAISAHEGAAGEELARVAKPDVVFVDMMLPGVSGLDIISHLATEPTRMYLCLATGMADYRLLKRAAALGAWSLISKPFSLPELMALLVTAERLLKAGATVEPNAVLKLVPELVYEGDTRQPVDDAIGAVVRYAVSAGADQDTVSRVLPILANELLSNALRHSRSCYTLTCRADAEHFHLCVSGDGEGFAWQRELARQRTTWDRSKARGLQLVSAMADEVHYEEDGRTACVMLAKVSTVQRGTAADASAAL